MTIGGSTSASAVWPGLAACRCTCNKVECGLITCGLDIKFYTLVLSLKSVIYFMVWPAVPTNTERANLQANGHIQYPGRAASFRNKMHVLQKSCLWPSIPRTVLWTWEIVWPTILGQSQSDPRHFNFRQCVTRVQKCNRRSICIEQEEEEEEEHIEYRERTRRQAVAVKPSIYM